MFPKSSTHLIRPRFSLRDRPIHLSSGTHDYSLPRIPVSTPPDRRFLAYKMSAYTGKQAPPPSRQWHARENAFVYNTSLLFSESTAQNWRQTDTCRYHTFERRFHAKAATEINQPSVSLMDAPPFHHNPNRPFFPSDLSCDLSLESLSFFRDASLPGRPFTCDFAGPFPAGRPASFCVPPLRVLSAPP